LKRAGTDDAVSAKGEFMEGTMPPTTEILENLIMIAEGMSSPDTSVPDLPYLELAKWIRVTRPTSRFEAEFSAPS